MGATWFIVVCDTLQSHEPEERFDTRDAALAEARRINRLGHAASICEVRVLETLAPDGATKC